jgi:hypothetical protein
MDARCDDCDTPLQSVSDSMDVDMDVCVCRVRQERVWDVCGGGDEAALLAVCDEWEELEEVVVVVTCLSVLDNVHLVIERVAFDSAYMIPIIILHAQRASEAFGNGHGVAEGIIVFL